MERLLSIAETMKILGIRKSTLYCWVHQKKMPYVKLGRRCLRFRESDIMNWISDKATYPNPHEELPHVKRTRPACRSKIADEHIERIVSRAKREAKK